MLILVSLLTTFILSNSIQSTQIMNYTFNHHTHISTTVIFDNPLESELHKFAFEERYKCESSIFAYNKNSSFQSSFETFGDFCLTRVSNSAQVDEIYTCVTASDLFTLHHQVSNFLAKTNSILSKPKVYLLYSASAMQQSTLLENANFSFAIDSEVFLVFSNIQTRSISIYERVKYKQAITTRLISSWNTTPNYEEMKCMEKISVIQNNFLPPPISHRRGDLEGINMAVVAQNDPDYQPRIKTTIHSNGSAEFVDGMCLEVLKLLQFLLKFSYTAIDGAGWVGIFPNGTWTGMSGQIVGGEADLSISQASTVMMADQTNGISFLHSTSTGTLVAIFKQPHLSTIRDIILTAFHTHLWICYLLIWIILLICLKIVFTILNKYDMAIFMDLIFSKDSLFWAISATSNVGWHMTPASLSVRLIFTMGFFLASFMYVAYSASMVTNLSTETIPIKNSDDLVDSSIGIFADKWLPMSQTVMEKMYNQRNVVINNLDIFYNQLELIIPKLMNNSWAFITFPDAISVVFHRLNFSDVFYCKTIYTVDVSKVFYPNAMYIKKGSPIREIFNTRILLMIERGFLSRLNQFYDRETQILCLQQSRAYRGGLTIRDAVTPFLFITAGFIVSLLILVLERKPWLAMMKHNGI